jgi:hypothetical protein
MIELVPEQPSTFDEHRVFECSDVGCGILDDIGEADPVVRQYTIMDGLQPLHPKFEPRRQAQCRSREAWPEAIAWSGEIVTGVGRELRWIDPDKHEIESLAQQVG